MEMRRAILAWLALFLLTPDPLFAEPTNVALNKTVILKGTGFYLPGGGGTGAEILPATIVDGTFLSKGSGWNNGTVWWVHGTCIDSENLGNPIPNACAIEIDLAGTFQIESFVFQGDSDWYFLQFWDEGSSDWQMAWLVPNADGEVKTRPNPDDENERWLRPEGPIVTNRLRIVPSPPFDETNFPGTDGDYSLSEIQAFGEPFVPPPPPVDCLELVCTVNPERLEGYLTDEADLCYKVEVLCDEHTGGGVRLQMGEDGGVGGDYGFFVVPDEVEVCGGFIWHIGNTKFEHSCFFDNGEKVDLKLRAANPRFCWEEVAFCPPPPGP